MIYTLASAFSWFALFAGTALAIVMLSASILFMVHFTALIWNRISWKLLDMYGGIKVFNEYKKHYKENQFNKTKEQK